jgi:hypothetical protein
MKIFERTKSDTSEPLNFPHITADTFVRRTRSSAYCALRLSPKTHHVSSRLSGATRNLVHKIWQRAAVLVAGHIDACHTLRTFLPVSKVRRYSDASFAANTCS